MSMFLVVSVQAQEETKKEPSLQDAQTRDEVYDYLMYKCPPGGQPILSNEWVADAELMFAVSDRLLKIAKNDWAKQDAYHHKILGFCSLARAKVEDAEQKMEAYLDELTANGYKEAAEKGRFQLFITKAEEKEKTPENYATFLSELKPWIDRKIPILDVIFLGSIVVVQRHEITAEQFFTELLEYVQSTECTLPPVEKMQAVKEVKQQLEMYQFGQFHIKALETVNSPESFDTFKAELKEWINRKTVNVFEIPKLGLLLAEKNGVPAEQFMNELIEFLQSPECSAEAHWKEHYETEWKKLLLTAVGSDPKLYGRTLDDKEFDWANLRGKYVLIQVTATWCGPCKMAIPGMQEAYKKYRDKGFEIVSVYTAERGDDPVAMVKREVEQKGLPWIIISETLTEKAREQGQSEYPELGGSYFSEYWDYYGISGVPTMVLVDKEGKIIMTQARGAALQTKLAEIFE
jgi:thiol-disulfide isomerase/thioredoxin